MVRRKAQLALVVGTDYRVFWVTSEILSKIPRRRESDKRAADEFLRVSKKIVNHLSRDGVQNVFQDYEKGLEGMSKLLKRERESLGGGPLNILTPEPLLYGEISEEGDVVDGLSVSRKVDVVNWRTAHYHKRIPRPFGDLKKVFLDTVSFTGRTLKEVSESSPFDSALVDYSNFKTHGDLSGDGINVKSVEDLSEFDAVWHIDDLVSRIALREDCGGGSMGPSHFLSTTCYHDLNSQENQGGFENEFKRTPIERYQKSPNLLLDLCRPDSFLARSFSKDLDTLMSLERWFARLETIEHSHKFRRDVGNGS